MHRGKILVVEDDPGTTLLIRDNLEKEGYIIRIAGSIDRARGEIRERNPDILILDRKLPDGDGIDFCRELKAGGKTARIPVLFLTAAGNTNDKILGLNIGGDDYLAKPFDMRELLARVSAMLRRAKNTAGNPVNILKHKGVLVDVERHECSVDGKKVSLWPKEFELLKVFLEKENKVLTREFLSEHVWNNEYLSSSRTIEMTVQRLRKKLGNKGKLIETVKGYGFKLKG